MTTEKNLPCAVWNADGGEWVMLDSPTGMTTAATLMELVGKLGDILPLQVRYPGNISTVYGIQ